MTDKVILREANVTDRDFIFALSPRLSEVADLSWHSETVVAKMQDDEIAKMLEPVDIPHNTLIAQKNEIPLGFIHFREHKDEISYETCGTIPLLAVSPSAQGMGVGQLLIQAAEDWAKARGYRLLHLEVFANNAKARGFYQYMGFEDESLNMIKALGK